MEPSKAHLYLTRSGNDTQRAVFKKDKTLIRCNMPIMNMLDAI